MDWSSSVDGEHSPNSSQSSGARKDSQSFQDLDSFSEEDDLSDEFSLLDSDEEKRELRVSQHLLQVRVARLRNWFLVEIEGLSFAAGRRNCAERCRQEDVHQQQGTMEAAERERSVCRAEKIGAHTSAG